MQLLVYKPKSILTFVYRRLMKRKSRLNNSNHPMFVSEISTKLLSSFQTSFEKEPTLDTDGNSDNIGFDTVVGCECLEKKDEELISKSCKG